MNVLQYSYWTFTLMLHCLVASAVPVAVVPNWKVSVMHGEHTSTYTALNSQVESFRLVIEVSYCVGLCWCRKSRAVSSIPPPTPRRCL